MTARKILWRVISAGLSVKADSKRNTVDVSFLDARPRLDRSYFFFPKKCATLPGVGASSAASLDYYWTLTFISLKAGETQGGGGGE